jgi:hypothetical protein
MKQTRNSEKHSNNTKTSLGWLSLIVACWKSAWYLVNISEMVPVKQGAARLIITKVSRNP